MNISNRDIKLENTLLHSQGADRRPMVKLCDFGGAFLLAHSDPGGIMTGAREATCSDCIAGERPFGIECDFKSSLWRGGGRGGSLSLLH